MADENEPEDGAHKPDYEVGYGRPPKYSQFPPGKSGNPTGRKRKPKSTQDQMRSILSKRITITEGGQSKRLTLQEVMLRSIATKAAKGDLRAANFVLNLIHSDAAAQGETIEQSSLSPEDQALFEQMMGELTSAEGSDPTDSSTQTSVDSQIEPTTQEESPSDDT